MFTFTVTQNELNKILSSTYVSILFCADSSSVNGGEMMNLGEAGNASQLHIALDTRTIANSSIW